MKYGESALFNKVIMVARTTAREQKKRVVKKCYSHKKLRASADGCLCPPPSPVPPMEVTSQLIAAASSKLELQWPVLRIQLPMQGTWVPVWCRNWAPLAKGCKPMTCENHTVQLESQPAEEDSVQPKTLKIGRCCWIKVVQKYQKET